MLTMNAVNVPAVAPSAQPAQPPAVAPANDNSFPNCHLAEGFAQWTSIGARQSSDRLFANRRPAGV